MKCSLLICISMNYVLARKYLCNYEPKSSFVFPIFDHEKWMICWPNILRALYVSGSCFGSFYDQVDFRAFFGWKFYHVNYTDLSAIKLYFLCLLFIFSHLLELNDRDGLTRKKINTWLETNAQNQVQNIFLGAILLTFRSTITYFWSV